jgi:hypothetical protein
MIIVFLFTEIELLKMTKQPETEKKTNASIE